MCGSRPEPEVVTMSPGTFCEVGIGVILAPHVEEDRLDVRTTRDRLDSSRLGLSVGGGFGHGGGKLARMLA